MGGERDVHVFLLPLWFCIIAGKKSYLCKHQTKTVVCSELLVCGYFDILPGTFGFIDFFGKLGFGSVAALVSLYLFVSS